MEIAANDIRKRNRTPLLFRRPLSAVPSFLPLALSFVMVLFRPSARGLFWHAEAFVLRPMTLRNLAVSHINQQPFRQQPILVHAENHPRWMSVPRGGQNDYEDKEEGGRSFRLLRKIRLRKDSSKESSDAESSIASATTATLGNKEDDELSTSSSSSSSLLSFRSTSWQQLGNRLMPWRRSFRRRAGEVVTLGGFLASATTSLYTHRRGQWKRLQPTLDALVTYFRDSRLNTQLSQSLLNMRLLDNLVLLSRLQKQMHANTPLPELAALEMSRNKRKRNNNNDESILVPTAPQALRWMKFATAAYGNAMIRAAQLDVQGKYDTRLSLFSAETTVATRVGEHVGVPAEDLVLLDIDYDGSDEHLRHFVAVDHVHREIVLSLRGTFSVAEIVVDAAAFAAPFVGGQAHAEMAQQARVIWETTGPKILELCEANPDYTLVITGHSLGAGTACLLHLLLHDEKRHEAPRNPIQCVAFAAPPVYANPRPSLAIQQAMRQCVNFVHGHDMVPFLSVDSARHLLRGLEFVQDKMRETSYRDRLRLFWGYKPLDEAWVQEFQNLPHLDPLPGAPVLVVPAAVNVWLTPCRVNQDDSDSGNRDSDDDDDDDDYDPNVYYQAHRCDSHKMAKKIGLQVDLNMLQDHFPPRYEHALHHFHPDSNI